MKNVLSIYLTAKSEIVNEIYQYDMYWSRIGYILNKFFDEEEAYVYFVYFMEEIFPKVQNKFIFYFYYNCNFSNNKYFYVKFKFKI